MKFSSKLAISGVVAGLSAAQVLIACPPPQIEIADAPAPEICIFLGPPVTEDISKEVIVEPAVEDEVEVIDETVIDENGTGEKVTDEEVVVEDGGEVPIDWVKRDLEDGEGVDPDVINVIFYNMSGGGPQPTGPADSPIAKGDAGKDDTATAAEAKTVAPVAPIVREKKGPVALVKGARVFLRH